MKEYYAAKKLGWTAIGNEILPLTAFKPSYKLTYCTKCWKLGDLRDICNESTRCRVCLDNYEKVIKHQYQGHPKCAQHGKDHWSLDSKCSVRQQYRKDLKEAVDDAISGGKLLQKLSK
jgi:hypothetical protein